ncbi:dihydrolipoyl dehydrogenase [Chloroflexota bacterium]
MKHYDVIVIGSGSGALISDEATSRGLRVALVDKGPLGGTCLNVGCIPSKMLIYPADRIVEIQEATKFGIHAEIRDIEFNLIMDRMRQSIAESQGHIREGIAETQNLDFYEAEGRFVDDYTMEVNGTRIRGDNIVIASGSRIFIPPIKGLDGIDYLTNESALQLRTRPESLLIIGGGYIAVEYGHFFAAMGTKVTILEMADRLVLSEEPELAHVLQMELGKRMEIHTNAQAREVQARGEGVVVVATDGATGKQIELTAQKLMVAVGRRSNADLLDVEKTGVETDEKGYVKVNKYLETSRKNIFAVGDANGRYMFTHVANKEAAVLAENLFYGGDVAMDYGAIPHAVYSYPQIASVGMTEEGAMKQHVISVSRVKYWDIAKGEAMMEKVGYAKAILQKDNRQILGFHIIGPYAPVLVQEVVNAMTSGGHVDAINEGIHIHPALSELVPITVNSIEEQ